MSVQPSTEAIKALVVHRYGSVAVDPWQWDGMQRPLTAAYAIDAPAIHAAGAAEGREQAQAEIARLGEELARAKRYGETTYGVECHLRESRDKLYEENERLRREVAESRAAMRDEIVGFVRACAAKSGEGSDDALRVGTVALGCAADAIEAAFPTTGPAA